MLTALRFLSQSLIPPLVLQRELQRFIETRKWFIIPLFIVASAKLLASILLYITLDMGHSETYWMNPSWGLEGPNAILRSGVDAGIRWPYLFLGWDSAWYLSIAAKGYDFSSQSWAFFPGLPLLTWLLDLVVRNPLLSLVLLTNSFGVLWIPIFQQVAETYTDRSTALKVTLFYAFSPFTFLFSTVAYSEGLFLLSTLGAWHYFKNEKTSAATLLASLAAISRPTGLLIILPMLYKALKNRGRGGSLLNRRDFLIIAVPCLSLFSWLLYCKIIYGDWFAPFNRAAWNNLYSLLSLISRLVLNMRIETPFENYPALLYYIFAVVLTTVPVILTYALTRMDKALALYSGSYLFGLAAFAAIVAMPRFISYIFPIWIPPALYFLKGKRSSLLTVALCASFYLVSIILWHEFLNGVFIS